MCYGSQFSVATEPGMLENVPAGQKEQSDEEFAPGFASHRQPFNYRAGHTKT